MVAFKMGRPVDLPLRERGPVTGVGPEPRSFGSGDCPTMYLAWRRLEVDAELRALR